MAQAVERDFPLGHPAAVDTVIGSTDHKLWVEQHKFSENARDFPPGHPKAADTPGNLNHIAWTAGVDPHNPHLEAFTGRGPAAAQAVKDHNAAMALKAKESPALVPVEAMTANAALDAKRKELGVDVLTMAQTQAVLATLQQPKK